MTVASKSEQIKKDLNRWYAESDYEDVKFFIEPGSNYSLDECAKEMLDSVRRLDRKELQPLSMSEV